MGSEAKSFLEVWSILLASLCYCYFIASKIPKGKLRFFLFLPSFYLFITFPLYFPSLIIRGVLSYFITYLGCFKLLSFTYDHGPLYNQRNLESNKQKDNQTIKLTSLLRFIVVATFPIKIIDPITHKHKPTKVLLLNLWHQALLLSILPTICCLFKERLHLGIIWMNYCCIMYLFLDIMVRICNKLVGFMMDVDQRPPFDEPYLSTSVQDFWSRRWNLMVTDVTRNTIYDPMRTFLSNYLPKERVVIPSLITVFLVSGLMHELIFYYLTCAGPTWEVTCFFGLNGLVMILEGYLKKGLGHKMRLHRAISAPLTLGWVMGTGYFWFFPPFLRNQVDIRMAKEAKAILEFVIPQLFE